MIGTPVDSVARSRSVSSSGSQRCRSTSASPYPTWNCIGSSRSIPHQTRKRCSTGSATRSRAPPSTAPSRAPAAPATSPSDGRAPSSASPTRYAATDLTPTASALRSASRSRNAAPNPAAEQPPASTCSATASSRTTSRAAPPARAASSSGEVIGSGREAGAKGAGELGGGGGRLGQVAGVDEEGADPGARDKPAVDLGGAELGAAAQVRVDRCVPFEIDQRCAPAPQREPDLRVEERAGQPRWEGGRPGGLGEHRLDLGAVQVARHQPVAVVVDQGDVDHRVASSAAARSAISSAGSSSPTESRIMPSSIRAARRSSGVSEKCEELNGVLTSDSTPPRLFASLATCNRRITAPARGSPPATVKATIAPPIPG